MAGLTERGAPTFARTVAPPAQTDGSVTQPAGEMPSPRAAGPSLQWLALPVLVAAVLALLGSWLVFPFLSENHDEPVYLLQAEALRAGSLTAPAPAADPGAFRPWLTALREGRYVFKYTPAHAALLAAGRTLFGSYRASLALIAAGLTGAILLLACEVLSSRKMALTATWAFVLSPLTLVLNSTYLSYSSSVMLLAGFAGLMLRGINRGRSRLVALSGVAWGLAFFARPLDALAFGLPLLIYLLLRLRDSGRINNPALFAAGAAGPLALTGAFNWAVMGSPLRFPFSVLDGMDSLGFGPRRMIPGPVLIDYDLGAATAALGQQVLWLQVFIFGGPLMIGLFAWYLVRRRAQGVHRALAWIALTIPAAYFFFWGSYHITIGLKWGTLFGPMYWLPMLVPLTMLGTIAWFELHSRQPRRARRLAAIMALLTLAGVGSTTASNFIRVARDRDVYRAVASGEGARGRSPGLSCIPGNPGGPAGWPRSWPCSPWPGLVQPPLPIS